MSYFLLEGRTQTRSNYSGLAERRKRLSEIKLLIHLCLCWHHVLEHHSSIKLCVHVCVLLGVLLTRPASVSRPFPIVDNSLHRASSDDSRSSLMSATTQLCTTGSRTMFRLNSSPINLTIPSKWTRALSFSCPCVHSWPSASYVRRIKWLSLKEKLLLFFSLSSKTNSFWN